MRISSVRGKLILWYVGTLALILALFAVGVRCIVEAHLSALVDRDLAADARFTSQWWVHNGNERLARMRREFAERADPGRFQGRDEGRRRRRGRLPGGPLFAAPPADRPAPPGSASPSPDYWRRPHLLDARGHSIFPGNGDRPWDHRTFELSLAGARAYSVVTVNNAGPERLRVLSVPLIHTGVIDGVAQFAHPLTEVRALIRRLTAILLALIPLSMLAAGLGGAFLANRALSPVRTITHAAARIGAADLSHRLPESGGDEFAELASTFNAMIARLEDTFRGLERAYEQQRRFTADASHELRTPLTTIKANTSLALFGQRTPAEYREALTAADHAADMMNRIVQDLLLLARSDNGELRLQLRPVLVREVIDRAVSVARAAGGPEIRVEIPTEASPAVLADPHHLVRLFVNLLKNAARHTPSDGIITVSCQQSAETTVVSVSDTGEGIPPEHLPHVLERFYRVDAARARAQGGTGLGLAICRSIAEAHHGALAISSKVGIGTRVDVSLLPASAQLAASAPPDLAPAGASV